MSRPLDFPAKCTACSQLMPAGTDVDFYRDENDRWCSMHVGAVCPEPSKATKVRRRYDFRVCPEPRCYAGHPGIAYPAGCCPPRCPFCNKPWLADDYLDVAA